jgi:hypothetical protein
MTYLRFLEKYCEKYNLVIDKKLNGDRLCGSRLMEMKLLCYISRLYFNKRHSESSRLLQIPNQSALVFYYDVLNSKAYKKIAEEKYKEILDEENSSMSKMP